MALSIFLRCVVVLVSLSLGRAYTYVPQGTWDKPAPARVPTTTTPPAAPSCKGVLGCIFRSPMRVEAPSSEAARVHVRHGVHTASSVASTMGPVSSAAPSGPEASCKGVFRCIFRRRAGIESGSSETASVAGGKKALPAVSIASTPQASTSRPASSAAPSEPQASRKGVLGRLFRRPVRGDEELSSLKLSGATEPASSAPVEPEASCRGLGCWGRRRAGVKASSSAASGGMSGTKAGPSISTASLSEASHMGRASSTAPVQPVASCRGLLCRVFARRGGVGSAKQPSVEVHSVEVPLAEAARPSPLRLAYEDFRRLFGPAPLIVAVDRTVETCLSSAKAPPALLPPTPDVPPAPPRGYWRRGRVDTPPVKDKAASGGLAAGPITAPLSDDDVAKALCFTHGLCFGVEDDVAGDEGKEDSLLHSPVFWLMTALRFVLTFAVTFVLLHNESNAWARSAGRAAWRRVKEGATSASVQLKQFKAFIKGRWAQRPAAADLLRRLHATLPHRLAGLQLPALPPNLNLHLNLNLNFNVGFNWPRVYAWLGQCYHRVVQCPRVLCTCMALWWARVLTWPAEARRRVPALLASLRGLPAYLLHLFTSLRSAYTNVRSQGVMQLYNVLRTPDGRRRIKASITNTLWPPAKPEFWNAPRMSLAVLHRPLHEHKISEAKVGPFAHFFDARNAGRLLTRLKWTAPFHICPATSLLPIHAERGGMLGYAFVSLTPHSSHVAVWLLDARHSIMADELSLMRLALAYSAPPLALPVCPGEQLLGGHVPAQRQELRRAQHIIDTLKEHAPSTFDDQVLPGVEVLCRPALPSKKSRTTTHKVITATGGLYALEDAFTRVQEALMKVSSGSSAVGPAIVGVTDVAAPSAPTTRTSRPQ